MKLTFDQYCTLSLVPTKALTKGKVRVPVQFSVDVPKRILNLPQINKTKTTKTTKMQIRGRDNQRPLKGSYKITENLPRGTS